MKNYSIKEVLQHVPTNVEHFTNRKNTKIKIDFDGDMMKVTSDRLLTFKLKGIVCVSCGVEGRYFKKDYHGHPNPHFNLYAIDKEGEELLMTKKHIISKLKGGQSTIQNYQTMCFLCNVEKGNSI